MKHNLLVYITILIILLPLFVVLTPIISNYGKTGKNTFLIGKNYSYLTREEITENINTDFILPENIVLTGPDKNYLFYPSTVSASLNVNRISSNMLFRRLNEGVLPYIRYFFSSKNFTLDIAYDNQAFDNYLADLASQINKPYIPSQLQLKNSALVYQKGELGNELDTASLKEMILRNLSQNTHTKPIELPFHQVGYLPSDTEVEALKSKAQNIIGKSFILESEVNNITLTDATLISWLDFKNNYNNEAIKEYVQSTADSLKRDPVNAVFNFQDNKVAWNIRFVDLGS